LVWPLRRQHQREGLAELGYATVKNAKGEIVRAQQGTLEHIQYTLKSMIAKGGKAQEAAEIIMDMGIKNVDFSKIRTIFGANNEITEVIVKYFKI
jgi:hypothetical protein